MSGSPGQEYGITFYGGLYRWKCAYCGREIINWNRYLIYNQIMLHIISHAKKNAEITLLLDKIIELINQEIDKMRVSALLMEAGVLKPRGDLPPEEGGPS